MVSYINCVDPFTPPNVSVLKKWIAKLFAMQAKNDMYDSCIIL